MKWLTGIGTLILGGVILAFIASGSYRIHRPPPSPPPATSLPAPAVPPTANGAIPWSPATAAPAVVTFVAAGGPAQVTYGPAGAISTGTTPLSMSEAVPAAAPAYYVLTVMPGSGGPAVCQLLVNGVVVSAQQAPAGGSATCEIAQNFQTGTWEQNLSAA